MRIQNYASALFLTTGLLAGGAAAQQFPTSLEPFATISPADAGPTTVPKSPVMFDLTSIDKTADPCTDFYQYACGNWKKLNPIPPSETRWGSFNTLGEKNQYLLYQELKAAADAPKTPLQVKYGNYFAACMNVDLADKLGAKPIEPQLAAIAALPDSKHVSQLDATFEEKYGSGFLINVGVGQDQVDASKQILQTGQGGLTLPDRDYYLNQDERTTKLRSQYVTHITTMFSLLGDSPDQAAKEAAAVLKIETALAQGSMSRVEMRDPANRYHIMTFAEVQQLSPDFDWHALLVGVGVAAKANMLNVSSPGYVKTVNEQLATESLADMKSYLRWQTLHRAAPYLSQAFVDENFNFFSATLSGAKEQQPRWKRCTRLTDGALGEAVGQDWVKQNFTGDAKANMEKLVKALEHALGEDIQSLPWMSPETKVEAEKKLAAFRDKIGYPATWRDYSTLTVKRDDLSGNLARNAIFERKRNISKLGAPVDETEWGMTPPTVNAYYSPSMNDINFPAGILQPPFFDNTKDPAVNYGGIGVVIGHEMTHGFDDQGSKYGPTGNVGKSWFTDADLAKFKDRESCVANEYGSFEVAPGQKQDGRLTLGENTADNGGIRVAYQALHEVIDQSGPGAGYTDGKRDGYTPDQRFFLAFGQVWCENRTEQYSRVAAKTDPHSAGQWRTNGTVQNFDAFGKAFGCKVGEPMMPTNACRVW